MRSLAKYFYDIVKSAYTDWFNENHGKGIPGRLILQEFDAKLITEILANIHESNDFPITDVGATTGFIIAVEDHDRYSLVNHQKYSFNELARERNREGDFFCLMFVAEIKPTLEQVAGVDQSKIFERAEINKWVNIAKNEQENSHLYTKDHVNELTKFIAELTNASWNNRAFIEIDKINCFIERVIDDTIKDGMFWQALGQNFVHLGGVNRLNELLPLEKAGERYRSVFRALIQKTLFTDIDFWRAIHKNNEVEFEEIKDNLNKIRNNDHEDKLFCQKIEEFFQDYFENEGQRGQDLRLEIQSKFDCQNPYGAVLQAKNTKQKLKLGEETQQFFTDNDIQLPEEFKELLINLDAPTLKPEVNELRKLYFTYSKDIAENTKLDKAWLKLINSSKTVTCNNLVEGLLVVLSKSILIDDIGQDKVCLELAKDRRRTSLQQKNWHALYFFNNEYKDLEQFWSKFGDNFELDFGQVFDENFAESVDNKLRKERTGKTANELSFRIIRYAEDKKSPTVSWELKWEFNPYGFEAVKYHDFCKLPDIKGFFHQHQIALDPLYLKRADSSPTIDNSHMFLAISAGNMKKGAVIKKTAKESQAFIEKLAELKQHQYIDDNKYLDIKTSYEQFRTGWHNAITAVLASPLCANLDELEMAFTALTTKIMSLASRENTKELIYLLLHAHTITVKDNSSYAIYLPWSPFSLLIQSNQNAMLLAVATKYCNKSLTIGNKSDGVLAKLFSDLLTSYGKGVFLLKDGPSQWNDLVCTKSNAGYYEFSALNDAKNVINTAEIRAVINATTTKFLDTYPNERHHLQILCSGLHSYDHLLAVYDELLKIAENHEEELSISLGFICDDRNILDSIYQTICESFTHSRIDANITIRLINNFAEIEDGEVDLIFSFDPLFTHNIVAENASKYKSTPQSDINWEYCAARKVPADKIEKKSQFALNNHILDPTSEAFHKSFMFSCNLDKSVSFCREVSQKGLADEITKGLLKCNWLVIYDFLLCKDTLALCNNVAKQTAKDERRILRYVQGEGTKRSLAIITDKETHYITNNLNENLNQWQLVHPAKIPTLVDTIFSLSNSFSSDTLLRSVGNGNFSHDLVGTAGAAALVDSLFIDKAKLSPIFWIHLDDYLGWFKSSLEDDSFKSIGRTINYISDLLGIYLNENGDGQVTLSLIIIESKLTSGSQEQADKSRKQIKSTTDLIKSMLATASNIDFDYWLNKFYEFIIGQFTFIPNKFDFDKLINLDKSKVQVDLYGLSVVFHYGNSAVATTHDNLGDFDYLTQLSLSTDDTKTVFAAMLDESKQLPFKATTSFHPLSLNTQQQDEAAAQNDVTVCEQQSNYSATAKAAHVKPREIALDQLLAARELKNSSVSSESNQNTAVEQNPTINLVKQCINFLEENTAPEQPDIVDFDQVKSNIRQILSHAKLPSNFAETILTPNSIVIKLHGDLNLNPNKILGLKSNFLSVVGLTLRQVYPAPGVMVLVFDRTKRETVLFGKLLQNTLSERLKTLEQGFNDKIMLGQYEFGTDCVFYRLDGASPHALIGGQTKSGKSILMNNMIMDLLMTNSPESLRLWLFDPKQVEFAAYSRAPHLAYPVVLDKDMAVVRLEELERLMNDRYDHLREIGVKDFETYNRKHPSTKMTREVVFFDELADWILDSEFKVAAKDIIVRLSSKGRAAGVHLVLATQRPSADVVFPMLRANLDTKVALKVDRDQNSEIILGETGAENLLGYGHGIVKTEGATKTIQVGFTEPAVFDELIDRVIDYWLEVITNKV